MPLLFFAGVFFYIYLEISLLISIGSQIGVLPLILLMICISSLGLWLVKRGQQARLAVLRQTIQHGKSPAEALLATIPFFVAGVLLLIPGFLSDFLALLLLFPPIRAFFTQKCLKSFRNRAVFSVFGTKSSPDTDKSTVFEAEFERQADEDKRLQ